MASLSTRAVGTLCDSTNQPSRPAIDPLPPLSTLTAVHLYFFDNPSGPGLRAASSLVLPRMDEHGDLALVLHNPCRDAEMNPFCPIARLPVELLEIIFIYHVHDSYVYGKYGYGPCQWAAPSWVSVSYVCRHWRDVVLNCPTLWTYIPRTSQRWTQELLARSKNLPLKFYAELRGGDEPSRVLSIVEQAMNHVERIQTLCLHLVGMSEVRDCQILSKFLFSRAPCLEYVDVLGLKIMEDLEEPLLPFKTPALHTLKLMDCSIPWFSFTLSGLTTLELFSPSFPHSMEEFLVELRRMPGLVDLSLDDVLLGAHDFLSNGAVSATPTVNLPCLSELYVSAPVSTVVAFLTCVDIPLGARVMLKCIDDESLDIYSIYYRQLSSLLTQRITASNDPALAGPAIRSMVIHNRTQIKMQLIFSTLECGPEILPTDSSRTRWGWDYDAPLCVSIYPETAEEEDCMLDEFCGSIPLTNIRSLHFIEPVCSLDIWRKISRWLPNLRHIKLSGGYMPDITSMLFLPPHHDTENLGGDVNQGRNGIFAPELEELELYSICLSKTVSVCGDNLTPLELQSLYEAVSTREETRCRLTVNECAIHTDGGLLALEAVGRWENGRFMVTSKNTLLDDRAS